MRSYLAVLTEFSTYCKASVNDFHQRLAYWKQNILVLEISKKTYDMKIYDHCINVLSKNRENIKNFQLNFFFFKAPPPKFSVYCICMFL